MKDNEFDLEILENADNADIKIIADSCPASESDKERMFAMSRKIYKERTKESKETPVIEVSGVEIYKKSFWHKIVSVAAAIVLVAGGVAGGWAMLKKSNTLNTSVTEDSNLTSVTDNNTTTATNNMEPTEKSGKDSPLVDSDYAINDHVKVYNPILDKEEDVLVNHCYVSMDPFNMDDYDKYDLIFCNAAKLSEYFKEFEWKETSGEERYSHSSYNLIQCSYTLGDEYTESTPNLGILFYDYGLVGVVYRPNAQDEIIHKCYDIGRENIDKIFNYVLTEYELVKSNESPDKLLKLLDYSFTDANISSVYKSNQTRLSYIDTQKLDKAISSEKWTESNNAQWAIYDEDDGSAYSIYTILFTNEFMDDGCKMELYDHNLLKCEFNSIEKLYTISDELNDTIKSIIDNATGTSDFSNSSETVTIPQVKFMSFEGAEQELNKIGLVANIVKVTDEEAFSIGDVIKSEPAEGEIVPKGSVVTLYISSHGNSISFPLADFRGMNINDATMKAGYSNLKVKTEMTTYDEKKDIVVAQVPEAGETVKEGDEITLYYSNGGILRLMELSLPDDVNGRYQLDGILKKTDGTTQTYDFGVFFCPESKTVPIEIKVEDFENISSLNLYLLNTNTNKRALVFKSEYIRDVNNQISDTKYEDINIKEVFKTVQ